MTNLNEPDITRETLAFETIDNCAVITLNRPERLNAMTVQMRVELAAMIRRVGDGASVRGIVLTGAGRAFSAGEDLKETQSSVSESVLAAVESFHDITRAVLTTKVPVVAAVNGLAVGGASEVAMCCDARIGTDDSEYFMPENHIGLTISNASSLFLPRLVGHQAARVVLGAQRLDAATAHRIGLLDSIVEPTALVAKAVSLITHWNRPGSATSMHLALLRPTLDDVEAAFARENVAAQAAWEAGVIDDGIARFWREKEQAASS